MAKRKTSAIDDASEGETRWTPAHPPRKLANRRFVSPGASLMSTPITKASIKLNASMRHRETLYSVCMEQLISKFEEFVKSMKDSPMLDSIDLRPRLELYNYLANSLKDRYLPETGNTLAMCGMGDCGQLGLGEEKLEARIPKPISKTLLNDNIIGVACGGLHTLVLTKSGNVHAFGCNDDGSLGVVRRDTDSIEIFTFFEPVLISEKKNGFFLSETKTYNEPILQVATGDCQSLALSTNGNIYFWGSYKDKEGKQFRHMTPPDDKRKWHEQNLFQGQIILPPRGCQKVPIHLDYPNFKKNKPIRIECGNSFNAALLDNGQLLTWGVGECGEMSRELPPLQKTDNKNEKVYDNEALLQEYLTPKPVIYSTPTKLFAQVVNSVACGAFHMLVTTQDVTKVSSGKTLNQLSVYSSGLNNYGQLGHGDFKNRSILTKIEALKDRKITTVAAGTHHSMCLSINGNNLYTFGRGDSGQLGITDELPETGFAAKTPMTVFLEKGTKKNHDKITQITCGSNHNIVVTEKNEAYTWGFGDLSALGHGQEQDEFRPRKLKLSSSSLVRFVAAGGQHSAFIIENKKKQ